MKHESEGSGKKILLVSLKLRGQTQIVPLTLVLTLLSFIVLLFGK